MKNNRTLPALLNSRAASGKIGWILLWLIGFPVPLLLALFLIRGCT
ncbi:hypothetical protein HQ447_12250 [bacterium]|nr:hypothetical protein [bacterium]